MRLYHILKQTEIEAYIMKGEDYKKGHPAYDSFILFKTSGHYLVAKYVNGRGETSETILSERHSEEYVLTEASDEEEDLLRSIGWKMINL